MPASLPHRMLLLTRCLIAGLLLCLSEVGAEEVDFVRDIRPIISENCSFCHGPDESTREADLRLDVSDGAWSVIEKHDRSASDLFDRINSDDDDLLMPPPDSNRRLSEREIELIGRWIDQGANWEQHWSFRPIVSPPVPEVEPNPESPIRNPIDAFVQKELSGHPLDPSPQAASSTLVRRLCLDLTGLPPTPAQVQRFLSDRQPGAYERLVDRLLESPAYGQRMAWNWLDAARYADTNGYQGDRERTMWPWRDWVVDAFNDNLPYDQFTIWQLAGDLLPDATDQHKLATGFCRNHMINGEGGRIAEENRVEYVMDMSETAGTVWLGLTLNCCRCHDHKYDPITNAEYYQLFAFFNQTPVNGAGGDPQTAPNLAVPTPEQTARLAKLDSQISAQDQRLREAAKELTAKQSAWETAERKRLEGTTPWQIVPPQEVFAKRSRVRTLDDQSVLISGPPPDNDTYTFVGETTLPRVTGVRIEALRHTSLGKNSLSQSESGNFVLTEIEIHRVEGSGSETDGDTKATRLKIASAEATFEQGINVVPKAFDGDSKTGWAVYEGRIVDRDHAAVFRLADALETKPGMQLKIVLRHDSKHKRHNIGRFRVSLTGADQPGLTTMSDQLLSALNISSDQRDEAQAKLVSKAHRQSDPTYQSLQKKRDQLAKQRSDLDKSVPKVMVMGEREQPRQTYILNRGLYNKPTEEVTAKLPAFLPPSGDQTDANRLTLARWLVNPANPLTARVTVNRFWQQIFGTGLVKTTEDFGTQGETPIHMDLLDWMASRFVSDQWDVKNLMRLIVTSHTYRQSSKIRDAAVYELDPDNRMLARGARYRLPSWMLRDQALAASGLLNSASGGPSVNTYQPAGVWEEASFGKMKYQQDDGDKLYRRSLYTFWRRIIAPTMFFDSASRQTCTVKSSRTNTPLHALQTMNNVAYVEAARVLGELVLGMDAESDGQRIDAVMQRVLSRKATDAERKILLGGLARTRTQMQAMPENAIELISIGASERDQSLDASEHAAWTSLCLAVLNLDETLNRE